MQITCPCNSRQDSFQDELEVTLLGMRLTILKMVTKSMHFIFIGCYKSAEKVNLLESAEDFDVVVLADGCCSRAVAYHNSPTRTAGCQLVTVPAGDMLTGKFCIQ